jgi:hypothetical protein
MPTRPLSTREVVGWASAYREGTGRWPTKRAGDIPGTVGETWAGVDNALREGRRGLPGGSSLARFLADHCGAPQPNPPPLTVEQILAWADAWHERTGEWPTVGSGTIPGSGEKWSGVSNALRQGARGLPGGSCPPRLLSERRGVRNRKQLPSLSEGQILAWADAYQQRTSTWPARESGPIPEAPGETWTTVDEALREGTRGLRGPSSLARLLDDHGAKRNHVALPPLTKRQILAWADAHFARTGSWPNVNSGAVQEAPEERWDLIDNALRQGHRGQPGGSSLLRLLAKQRGARNPLALPPLTEGQVLSWADAYWHRTGRWPKYDSGPIPEAPGETWQRVDRALREGKRGLPGKSSVAKLLAEQRGETGTLRGRTLTGLGPEPTPIGSPVATRSAGRGGPAS